jgi:hypothetical protein
MSIAEPQPAVPEPRRRWYQHRLRALLVVVTLLAIASTVLVFTPLGWIVLLKFDQNPGAFDRERFEAIVLEVRALGLRPGESVELKLDDIAVPKSLRSVKPNEMFARGLGAGNVWATVTSDGKLKVVIETKDLGHAGEYGFAYSEAILIPGPLGDESGGWLQLDLPGRLNIVLPDMKIDDNWWRVCYNLD